MKVENYIEEIELPSGVSAVRDGKMISFKGPKGQVSRVLYSPMVDLKVEGNKVVISVKVMTKREKALVGTYAAHLRNMAKGVTEGHTYKLKICSGHFPMNVSMAGSMLTIKNFIGEKVPRTLKVSSDVKLVVDGDSIVIESADKEAAGQTAGSIEKLTRRPGFDRRIFQDGIYIVEKDGKRIE